MKPGPECLAGVQVADDPAVILVDTPGIMLPRLKESAFAWRAALLGLIPDHRVSLPGLFAFALYVLAQEPNVTELKVTLGKEVLPIDSERRDGQRHDRGVRLQDAFSARKVAKQALQAIASVSHLREEAAQRLLGAAAAGGAPAEVSIEQGLRTAQQTCSSMARPEPGGIVEARSAETRDVQSRRSGAHAAAPRTAADMLALMQAEAPGGACEGQHTEHVGAATAHTRAQDAAARCTATSVRSRTLSDSVSVRQGAARAAEDGDGRSRRKAVPGVWEPFEAAIWHACAHDMLERMLTTHAAHATMYDARCNDAMQRVVRLVRAGALGALLFEGLHALATPTTGRPASQALRAVAARPRAAPARL